MNDWKMNPNEVIKLINYYKQFACLWDYRSPDYKRFNLKKNAWVQLANEFGKDIEEVKKKVKCLRSAYVSEKKKVDDSLMSGSTIYEPRLFYYKELNYLDPVIILRKTPLNPLIVKEARDCTMEDDTSEHFGLEEVLLPTQSRSPSPSPSTSSDRKPKKKQRKRTMSTLKFNDVLGANDEFPKRIQQETIYSAFGKTVALQLAQLTPLEATSTMDEMHRLLSRNVIRSISQKKKKLSSEDAGAFSLSRSKESCRNGKLETRSHEASLTFDDSFQIKNQY